MGYFETMTAIEIKTRSLQHYQKVRDWCTQHFGETGNYADDTWSSRESVFMGYAVFYFEYQKDATWFMLRWS
jgi:hypothetical protein